MKVAITAEQPQMDSVVDNRFGRCRFFIFADTESQEWEAVENRDAAMSSGAGIAAAEMVVRKGAKAVITGLVGPKATQVLNAAGVPIVSFSDGTVRQALEDFQAGRAQPGQQKVADPSTMGWGRGQGRGLGRGGCGRGMGRGMGAGLGRGLGPGRGRRNA
jgi:predicted Fe-Mo cluster-binding NifX family protein